MIRALFNNRWFVITLAVAAGLFMVRSVAAPFLEQPDFADAEDPEFYLDDPAQAEAEAEAETPVRPSGQSVLSGALSWTNAPGRDPFTASDRQAVEQSRTLFQASTPDASRLPRLNGLVAGPESLLAVLDDRIVREGDRIGAFLVQNIEPGGVRLTAGYTDHWLRVADMNAAAIDDAVAITDQEISHGGDPGF